MTTPEQDRRMKLAREIVRKHYPEMPNDYSGRRVSIVLDAIQATEARMAAAVEADVEKIARIIDPSSWAVMDGYLSDMLRKYKGQNIGYDPDAFKHKQSMATARALLPIIRAHLEPTNEMAQAVMDCGPIGCCNISSTEARDIILSALKASPIGDVG